MQGFINVAQSFTKLYVDRGNTGIDITVIGELAHIKASSVLTIDHSLGVIMVDVEQDINVVSHFPM